MKAVSLLVKPAAGNCNLRCEYCFYRELSSSLSHKGEIMNAEVMEIMVSRIFEEKPSAVTIAFQGGEPTLAGLDYFRKLTSLVEEKNSGKIEINYAIQTNGMLIDEEWAKFLEKYNFLVGLSLDGTRELHDSLRPTPEKKGSYARVLKTADILTVHGVDFNILCVLTNRLARHPDAVYSNFKKLGFKYLQFIPCLDPFGEKPKVSYAPGAKRLGDFYIKLFDLWYADFMSGNYISVRWFDNLLRMARGDAPEQCGCLGFCPGQIVIEGDGSVYPCDFYVSDEFRLGNIRELSFSDMLSGDKMADFVRVSYAPAEGCTECDYRYLCRGGCRRDRQNEINGEIGKNRLCGENVGYKAFYSHIWKTLPVIMQKIDNWDNTGMNK